MGVASAIAGQQPLPRHDLGDDFRGGQVAGQPGLPRRTERAAHPAPGLRRHAHGHPVGVLHQHRLDECAVQGAPHALAGVPAIRAERPLLGQQPRQQLFGQGRAHRGGQVRHVLRRVGVPAEVVPGQLVGPELALPQLGDGPPPLRQLKIGKMARRTRHDGSVREKMGLTYRYQLSARA